MVLSKESITSLFIATYTPPESIRLSYDTCMRPFLLGKKLFNPGINEHFSIITRQPHGISPFLESMKTLTKRDALVKRPSGLMAP